MLEYSPKRTVNPQVGKGTQQSHRLLLALVLLVVALAAVLVKDRDFWFGTDSSTIDADAPESSAPSRVATKPVPPAPVQTRATVRKQATPVGKSEAAAKPAEIPAVTTKRTILAPLDVEVVAGSTHKNIRPGSSAQRLEITDLNRPAIQAATKAAEHESIAADAQPIYPPLGQHMNVQGSVILQVLIGTDGIIQNLQILHGPAILARAAEQAVREWHFKPIVQNGQAVESKATITVNFTIKVADNSAETTVAEMHAAERLIISR